MKYTRALEILLKSLLLVIIDAYKSVIRLIMLVTQNSIGLVSIASSILNLGEVSARRSTTNWGI